MTHTMVQRNQGEYPPGIAEWKCPECGRHTIVYSRPFRIEVLSAGNEYVQHKGMAINPSPEPPELQTVFDLWSDNQ